MKSGRCWREAGKERHLATCQYQATHRQRSPCMAYLRGDPISEVGGVGLLPALCRRRTAWRRNVLRSRRKTTVSSLPGAVQGERWLASESVGLIFLWQLSVVLLEDPARSDSRKYSKKTTSCNNNKKTRCQRLQLCLQEKKKTSKGVKKFLNFHCRK